MTPTVILHSGHASNTPTKHGRLCDMSFFDRGTKLRRHSLVASFQSAYTPRCILFLATAAGFEAAGILLIIGRQPWMARDNRRKDRIIERRLASKGIQNGTAELQWRWFV